VNKLQKLSIICLLLLYAAVYTPVSELFKLPVLIAHFQEHRSEDQNISFLRFLQLHYFNGSPKDADYDRDMQLPFKNGEYTLVSLSAIFLPVIEKAAPDVPVQLLQTKKANRSENFISSVYLSNIWQPPRLS
jgi:hypothetical protein